MAERLTRHLKELVLRLPMEDRVELERALVASMLPGETPDEGLDQMARTIYDQTGIEPRMKSRRPDVVRVRAAFSFAARREGYPLQVIADFLHCDHSTVIYYVNKVEATLYTPGAYPELYDVTTEYLNAIA